ncbi:Hypothetical predicted protein [Marmota monax]|uniref:Uncharacterized protein n=1 Tax=Marmota monax TaxID=9995 RepID=A0A5E4A0Y5_MARMO|nr:hypothetical protein GHT09_002132 [Marmota monax]VTJ50699.1 Hypothetical predicted protein [Marmota monax]
MGNGGPGLTPAPSTQPTHHRTEGAEKPEGAGIWTCSLLHRTGRWQKGPEGRPSPKRARKAAGPAAHLSQQQRTERPTGKLEEDPGENPAVPAGPYTPPLPGVMVATVGNQLGQDKCAAGDPGPVDPGVAPPTGIQAA